MLYEENSQINLTEIEEQINRSLLVEDEESKYSNLLIKIPFILMCISFLILVAIIIIALLI